MRQKHRHNLIKQDDSTPAAPQISFLLLNIYYLETDVSGSKKVINLQIY